MKTFSAGFFFFASEVHDKLWMVEKIGYNVSHIKTTTWHHTCAPLVWKGFERIDVLLTDGEYLSDRRLFKETGELMRNAAVGRDKVNTFETTETDWREGDRTSAICFVLVSAAQLSSRYLSVYLVAIFLSFLRLPSRLYPVSIGQRFDSRARSIYSTGFLPDKSPIKMNESRNTPDVVTGRVADGNARFFFICFLFCHYFIYFFCYPLLLNKAKGKKLEKNLRVFSRKSLAVYSGA